jgi:hypothetical protein
MTSRLWVLAILVASLSLVSTLVLAGPVAAQSASIDEAVEARAAYGLPAGRAHVEDLMQSLDNVASEKYGFPLTNAEYKELVARTTYVRRFQAETLPYVRGLDGYAGHWVDRADGGRIVISLTNVREAVKDQVRDRLPKDNRGVRFEEVNDSAVALGKALDGAVEGWKSLDSAIEPLAFAIRYRENRLVVKVAKEDLPSAKELRPRLEAELGVDVGFESSDPIVDSACPSRIKCFGPLRLGARMNYPGVYDPDNPTTQWNCGIGFMLTDHSILTAGHCTYERQTPWKGHQEYQGAYGRIGERTSSRYTTAHRDVSLIELEDWPANKTKRIYGDDWPTVLTMEDAVSEDMDVCVSLNRQDHYWCGYVIDISVSWKSDTADPPSGSMARG